MVAGLPTADPSCKKFATLVPTKSPVEARRHDGCNHKIYGAKGHPGTITLEVSDGTWKCTETYFGSVNGQGHAADLPGRPSLRLPAAVAGVGAEAAVGAAAAVAAAARRSRS